MTINRLTSQALTLDATPYDSLFAQPGDNDAVSQALQSIQPRLTDTLTHFLHPSVPSRFMVIKAPGTQPYLDTLHELVSQQFTGSDSLYGGHYRFSTTDVTFGKPETEDALFCTRPRVLSTAWAETEQLCGCIRQFNGELSAQPGLLHRANGGVLILSLRLLLEQPLMWLRVKQWVTRQVFTWFAPDETKPLPVTMPAIPLDIRLILVGDRDELAELEALTPEMTEIAVYSEYEDEILINDEQDVIRWRNWIDNRAQNKGLPRPASDAWPRLLELATRYTEDQCSLPVNPLWFERLFTSIATITGTETFSGEAFQQLLEQQAWREGYLAERILDDILDDQVRVDTQGEQVGQINALSVIEFPGHPRPVGEPSRISCVVHAGDGELTDIERKAELGGNIHAKGMMIMQAFLMAELDLDQQLPFSASLTFEQSYSEVDGDSASMAELCAFISALADVPVYQNIAITGSVDQFGCAQPVGGLNEKIESFFTLCAARGLTGNQGVIIPLANVRHLSLCEPLRSAVEQEQFYIWAIDDVFDALPLLTGLPWSDEIQGRNNLMQLVQERIAQASQQDARHRLPWPLRWLNWFNHN